MSPYHEEAEAAQWVKRAKRDKELAKDLREEGKLQKAVEVLEAAREAFETSPLAAALGAAPEPGRGLREAAAQLADVIGMLGGNYRRLGRLPMAQSCFERGRRLEEEPRYEVMSSYNMVNAITLPIETDPQALDTQREPLRRAVVALDRQVSGERRNDRWAWADLAQCQLLLGESDAALQSYARVRSLGDGDTLATVVGVLDRLAEANPTLRPRVAAVKALLEP